LRNDEENQIVEISLVIDKVKEEFNDNNIVLQIPIVTCINLLIKKYL